MAKNRKNNSSNIYIPPELDNTGTDDLPPELDNTGTDDLPPELDNTGTDDLPPELDNTGTDDLPPELDNTGTDDLPPELDNTGQDTPPSSDSTSTDNTIGQQGYEMTRKAVVFLGPYHRYSRGDVACFDTDSAEKLVARRIAVWTKDAKNALSRLNGDDENDTGIE